MSQSIANRRRLVRQLITTESVASQQALVDMLEAAGHYVTQATVSRDLDAIGAVKARTPNGGLRYEIPEDPATLISDARETVRIIDEFLDSMAVSGNLLIIRTRPGAANVVAGAVDRSRIQGVLGSVAGDDTVIVVGSEEGGGRGLLEELDRMGVRR
ncbi:MAG TPA: ArgR family transcriptional regulator [Acidimicrobiia bacterium]|jgi:transcriptional regulator of arginine metabolism|nr:ArgR family transcriptional regulator [Acidimicrobiia bacterium]